MKNKNRKALLHLLTFPFFLVNTLTMAQECSVELEETQLAEILQSNNSSFQKTDELFTHVKNRMDSWTQIPRNEDLETVLRFVANRLTTGNRDVASVKTALEDAANAGCVALGKTTSRLEVANEASKAAGIIEPTSERQLANIGDVGDAQNYVRLYTGVAYLLEADGGWDSNGEISFVSAHNWAPLGKNLRHQLRGIAEFEFTQVGAIDEKSEDGSPEKQETETNPFEAGGGIFRFNASIHYRVLRDLRFVVGAGFTTLPDESVRETRAESRYFLGARIDNPTLGADREAYLVLGLARDNFWKFDKMVDMNGTETVNMVDERDRLFAEGRFTIPGVFGDRNVWLSARVYADLPASGNGPSDIRVSLHISTDLNRLWNR